MRRFLEDAVDLACFRFKPLNHYVYPPWQPLLWLFTLGWVSALTSDDLSAPLEQRVVLFSFLVLLLGILIAAFFFWWLRRSHRWREPGSLFPLVALVSGVEFLQPLLDFFSYDLASLLFIGLLIYQTVLFAKALQVATGMAIRYIALGMLIFLPAALLILGLAWAWMSSAGWIDVAQAADMAGGL